MSRQIKFRAFFTAGENKEIKAILYGITLYDSGNLGMSDEDFKNEIKEQNPNFECIDDYDLWANGNGLKIDLTRYGCYNGDEWMHFKGEVMQFTGLYDKNGKEIYEGDVFRLEEAADHGDIRFYLVITWVKEWCMFATLRTDEYAAYLKSGVEALDEPMFWTYTLEDTNNSKYFLCGNIHQNPELL